MELNKKYENLDLYKFGEACGVKSDDIYEALSKIKEFQEDKFNLYTFFEKFGVAPEKIFEVAVEQNVNLINSDSKDLERIRKKSKSKEKTNTKDKKRKLTGQIAKLLVTLAVAAAVITACTSIGSINKKIQDTEQRLEQEYAMIAEDAGVIKFLGEEPQKPEEVDLKLIKLTDDFHKNLQNLPDTTNQTAEYIADETLRIAGENSGFHRDACKDIAIYNLAINNPQFQDFDITNGIVEYDLVHGEPDKINERLHNASDNNSTISSLIEASKDAGRGSR